MGIKKPGHHTHERWPGISFKQIKTFLNKIFRELLATARMLAALRLAGCHPVHGALKKPGHHKQPG